MFQTQTDKYGWAATKHSLFSGNRWITIPGSVQGMTGQGTCSHEGVQSKVGLEDLGSLFQTE